MPHLSIKDVPEPWAQALRQRAARNHRSLQGELMAILEQAIAPAPAAPAHDSPGRAVEDAGLGPVTRLGWKSSAQVVAEMRQRYPKPIRNQLSSIELIRQDRDER